MGSANSFECLLVQGDGHDRVTLSLRSMAVDKTPKEDTARSRLMGWRGLVRRSCSNSNADVVCGCRTMLVL